MSALPSESSKNKNETSKYASALLIQEIVQNLFLGGLTCYRDLKSNDNRWYFQWIWTHSLWIQVPGFKRPAKSIIQNGNESLFKIHFTDLPRWFSPIWCIFIKCLLKRHLKELDPWDGSSIRMNHLWRGDLNSNGIGFIWKKFNEIDRF